MKHELESIDYHDINEEIIEELKANISPRRLAHTLNVVEESKRLAEENGADVEKAEFIAIVHDRFRDTSKADNALTHGKIAANYVKEKYGIDDDEVLNSIRYHTTGRKGMSLQERIIFLADAIEKDREYDGVDYIREESKKGINYGVKASLENTINHLKDIGRTIDIDTIEALEFINCEIDNN